MNSATKTLLIFRYELLSNIDYAKQYWEWVFQKPTVLKNLFRSGNIK